MLVTHILSFSHHVFYFGKDTLNVLSNTCAFNEDKAKFCYLVKGEHAANLHVAKFHSSSACNMNCASWPWLILFQMP